MPRHIPWCDRKRTLNDKLFWPVCNGTVQPEEPPLPALSSKHVTEEGNTNKFISPQMVNAEMLAKKHSSVFSSVNMYTFKMQNIRASNMHTNTAVMQPIYIDRFHYNTNTAISTNHLSYINIIFHVIYGAPPTIITF